MLVVNPNHRLKTWLAAVEPPLWAGLIAGYDISIGNQVDILDAEALDLTLDQTVKVILKSRFNHVVLVVMGNNPSVSSTPKMPIAEAIAERIQRFKDISMTGIHPIACGSRWPVMHEAFQGFPMMPWDKLPMEKYRAHNWHCLDGSARSPYASIYTSFGCPFNCYYCNIHILYRNKQVRLRPIDDVLKEVDILATRYGVRNIKIWDELFALNEARVIDICNGLKSYDLNIWAYARLDTVTERMLKAMKAGGINWLAYGFENVKDPKFIKGTEKKIEMSRDAGINIIANFMFGLPGTTSGDDQASVDFARKHLFEFINFYTAKPYPGSAWFIDWAKTNKMSDYNFSQYGNQSEFRKKAFNDYFTNPAYLEMISKKFGQQGEDQIKAMLAENFG